MRLMFLCASLFVAQGAIAQDEAPSGEGDGQISQEFMDSMGAALGAPAPDVEDSARYFDPQTPEGSSPVGLAVQRYVADTVCTEPRIGHFRSTDVHTISCAEGDIYNIDPDGSMWRSEAPPQ